MRTIPLAALQHYAFCPRQCALIHNEQAWTENYLTAQGRSLHERVDSGEPETRKGVRFERSVHVSAQRLGISGIIDMVEHDLVSGSLKHTARAAFACSSPVASQQDYAGNAPCCACRLAAGGRCISLCVLPATAPWPV